MPTGGPPVPAKFWFHPMTISSPPTQNKTNPLVIYIKSMGKGTWSDEVRGGMLNGMLSEMLNVGEGGDGLLGVVVVVVVACFVFGSCF